MISTDIGIWLGAILALIMMSVLFKENPVYRLAEAIFIGGGTGHAVLYGILNIQKLGIGPMLKGQITYILPLLLGIIFFTRLLPDTSQRWPSIYPVSILTGIGMGLAIRAVLISQVIGPLSSTILPLTGVPIGTTFDNLIIIVLTITSLMYFTFSIKHTGAIGYLTRIGRYGMMIAFGQAIGSKVITFTSSFLGVITFLLFEWLGLA
jgi:hypothetical protein